jgi:hypothetical protein
LLYGYFKFISQDIGLRGIKQGLWNGYGDQQRIKKLFN